jgi:NDP-sugar pyrophosphorylase family protein
MINILIPLAGKNQFFLEAEYPFPKPLIEFNGKTMIEHIIDNFSSIQKEKQFIFIVNSEDCKKYHLDNVLNILTNHTCKIIKLDNETKGAACSAMMAVEYINNDTPLIISNADQLFDICLDEVINSFESSDAGVITFESIHPRWSYVRLNSENKIIETAEKRPISKSAIAGFYYFKNGKDFINSSSKMIKKDASVNGLYYIAPTLNEMVLENKTISIFQIENSKYHTFYTPQKIKEYERLMSC